MKEKSEKKKDLIRAKSKLTKRKVDEAYKIIFANGVPAFPPAEFRLYRSVSVVESANAGV